METKPLKFEYAGKLFFEYAQTYISSHIVKSTKPLDFSCSDLCDSLATRISKNLEIDLNDEADETLELLYARLKFAISFSVMEPDGIITHVPSSATDEEILSFLFSAEIVGMILPEQEIQ